jgi:heme exporter protein A
LIELEARGVACVRGGREVFRNVAFKVDSGELLGLRGPNGAGKSSLLRLVAGVLRPTQGEIVLRGADPELTPGEQAHYVGHLDALKPSLTVEENLRFWGAVLGATNGVADALAAVGLETLARSPALYLSAGQRRRLSLARILAAPRPIWLLDEPGSTLDAAGAAMLAEIMRRHLAGGGLILVAEHLAFAVPATRELRLGSTPKTPAAGSPL